MKSCREIANASANISSNKRQKTESFDSLLDTAAKEKIRSCLDAYYLKDNNPGEWLFLEIAFFELHSLRAPPTYQDLKVLLANGIYKKIEVNLENFLLKLFLDKITDPELIIYLLQNNSHDSVISLSKAEMMIVIDCLVKKEKNFIVLLVKIAGSLIEKTANSSYFFLKNCSKYLSALEKIAFLKQNLIDEINLESIHHTKDFLKTMEQVSEHIVAPLKALRYWETEIKRQLLRCIEILLSKTIVASSLAMDPPCLETSNRFQFFQVKAIHLLSSQGQYSASSESNVCTKPALT